jgi:hypothetical protein
MKCLVSSQEKMIILYTWVSYTYVYIYIYEYMYIYEEIFIYEYICIYIIYIYIIYMYIYMYRSLTLACYIIIHLLILMPFWLVCILHMELSFLVCVVNEFWVSKHHHHYHSCHTQVLKLAVQWRKLSINMIMSEAKESNSRTPVRMMD